jgi:hypothetical protein
MIGRIRQDVDDAGDTPAPQLAHGNFLIVRI